jgi:hypothetical protein
MRRLSQQNRELDGIRRGPAGARDDVQVCLGQDFRVCPAATSLHSLDVHTGNGRDGRHRVAGVVQCDHRHAGGLARTGHAWVSVEGWTGVTLPALVALVSPFDRAFARISTSTLPIGTVRRLVPFGACSISPPPLTIASCRRTWIKRASRSTSQAVAYGSRGR